MGTVRTVENIDSLSDWAMLFLRTKWASFRIRIVAEKKVKKFLTVRNSMERG
jgi:predicted NAD-dependent protein-ADP-ribosyltransferase YbiA (DUF1768 family)